MGKAIDIIGQVYGRLTVTKKTAQRAADGSVVWSCECSCGSIALVSTNNLRSGDGTKSCGCLFREVFHGTITHGLTRNYDRHPLYRRWCQMRERCTIPKHPRFKDWGGRGIRVCERWNSFGAFVEDMGMPPASGMQLDRYPNNDGNYEPGNVRWATPKQNSNNRRPRRKKAA